MNRVIMGVVLLMPFAANAADPIPSGRRTDWTYAGVPGGIPNRTKICATLNPGASSSAISSALSSCENSGGGVVFLNAGTYNISGPINMNLSNVSLRGAGADKTILSGSGVLINAGSGNSTGSSVTITGGGVKGTRTITVSSTTGLSVGTMFEVSRLDDPNIIIQGQVSNRNMTQDNVVTAIVGNVVTVRNPWLYDFTSAAGGAIKWLFPGVKKLVGLENLKLEHNTTQGETPWFYCDSCWMKGIESSHSVGYHFTMLGTVNFEVRDSYVHHGATGPNNSGIRFYGNYAYGNNSHARLENIIFNQAFPAIELNGSSSGLYIGYNYVYGSNGGGVNGVTWTLDDGHAPFNIMNLWEGNIAEMIGADNYYGGTAFGTIFRNYITGYNPNFNARGDSMQFDREAYYYNVIGNVIGSTQQNPTAYTGCYVPAIYRLGMPNLGNCETAPSDGFNVPGGYPDAKVAATMIRWGNYDYFNHATRFLASEIPSGVPVPADQILPPSYIYVSKPAWWMAGVPWPPIGPDIVGGNGDTSGHVNKIPAQRCWESRNLLTTGTFSADACYTVVSTPAPPSPITGATTTVH